MLASIIDLPVPRDDHRDLVDISRFMNEDQQVIVARLRHHGLLPDT
jgi:hypothetical protein